MLAADESFEEGGCVTAQHREMQDQVFTPFEMKPDYDFHLMKVSQIFNGVTASIVKY